MTTEIFLAGLAGMTFVAVLIFILTSKKKTEDDLHTKESEKPKSALAKDGPTGKIEDRL